MKRLIEEISPQITDMLYAIFTQYGFTLHSIIVVPVYNNARLRCFESYAIGLEEYCEKYEDSIGDYKQMRCVNSVVSPIPTHRFDNSFNMLGAGDKSPISFFKTKLKYLRSSSRFLLCRDCTFCIDKADFFDTTICFQKEHRDKQKLSDASVTYIRNEIRKAFLELLNKNTKVHIKVREDKPWI